MVNHVCWHLIWVLGDTGVYVCASSSSLESIFTFDCLDYSLM